MFSPTRFLRDLSGLAFLSVLAVELQAQEQPVNSTFLGGFDQPGSVYADVWGAGSHAYLARFGQPRVDIVNISNPSNPTLAATYLVQPPDTSASAQDVKVANGLMFVGLEGFASSGCEIVDVRNPNNPQFLTKVDPEPGNFETAHNLFYDDGWLYMVNSFDNTIAIVDLRSYDPDNAPSSISSHAYRLQNVGTAFIHDITVLNGRLYASGWDSLEVFDVSNLATTAPQSIGSVQGTSSHAVWPTADGKYVVTTEERQGGATRLYEVVELGGGNIRLEQRDSWLPDASAAFSAHNPLIVGDRVYISHYSVGVIVLEIDRSTHTLERVASYDTSTTFPSGYGGCWGVFPYLGEDRVLASDEDHGLFVIDFSGLQISWPNGRPTVVQPLGSDQVTVQVTAIGNSVVQSVELKARVEGGTLQTIPMASIGGDQYQAALPTASCGERVEYWVTAKSTSGGSYDDPMAAGSAPHEAFAASGLSTTFFDDFSTDQGWSVTNSSLSAGAWERATPNASGACPDRDDPDGAGTHAYVTQNGSVGGSSGAADVDGGPTTLLTPVFSAAGDALISYSRWFYNNNNDGDSLVVEITRGDGWQNVETVTKKAGGWVKHSFRVSDILNPGPSMRMRFRTADNPNNAVTEAGLDEFRIEAFQCLPAASSVSRNGSGINPVGFVEATPPAIGTDWITSVDIATPGASASLLAISSAGMAQFTTGFGELLIDVSVPFVAPVDVGLGAHSVAIPADTAMLGITFFTQAATFSPGSIVFQNAIDITFGY